MDISMLARGLPLVHPPVHGTSASATLSHSLNSSTVSKPAPNTIPWHQQEIMRQVLARTKGVLLHGTGGPSMEHDADDTVSLSASFVNDVDSSNASDMSVSSTRDQEVIELSSDDEDNTMDTSHATDTDTDVIQQQTRSISEQIALRHDVSAEELTVFNKLKSMKGSASHVIIDKYNTKLTLAEWKCIINPRWLNDEVINFYMLLLQERSLRLLRDYHYFSSFFYSTLMSHQKRSYTFSQVKRWTKKFDVFQKEKIFIPCNIFMHHWVLVILLPKKKELHFYDSMHTEGRSDYFLDNVWRWLTDEAEAKMKPKPVRSEWRFLDHKNHVSQQRNGNDCGAFVCIFCNFVSDDLEPVETNIAQKHVYKFRIHIGAAIALGQLPY